MKEKETVETSEQGGRERDRKEKRPSQVAQGRGGEWLQHKRGRQPQKNPSQAPSAMEGRGERVEKPKFSGLRKVFHYRLIGDLQSRVFPVRKLNNFNKSLEAEKGMMQGVFKSQRKKKHPRNVSGRGEGQVGCN